MTRQFSSVWRCASVWIHKSMIAGRTFSAGADDLFILTSLQGLVQALLLWHELQANNLCNILLLPRLNMELRQCSLQLRLVGLAALLDDYKAAILCEFFSLRTADIMSRGDYVMSWNYWAKWGITNANLKPLQVLVVSSELASRRLIFGRGCPFFYSEMLGDPTLWGSTKTTQRSIKLPI